MRLSASLRRALAFPPLVLLIACGGGGGSEEPPCAMPGVLRALAVQGQPAPGTLGNFGAFPASGLAIDVAAGGWSVFLATTTDATRSSVVYVARPDGVVLPVFAVGDAIPNGSGGTISGFLASPLAVTSAGRVLCQATVTGDAPGRTGGLLTARVAGPAGGVVDHDSAVYLGADMAASGVAGTLATIEGERTVLAEDGTVFFTGVTSGGLQALWLVESDGTGLTKLIAEDDALGGPTLDQILAVDIDAAGSRVGLAVERSDLKTAVYSGTPGGSLSLLAEDGQPLTAPVGGGNIVAAYDDGPLLVYASGAVVWKATGSAGAPDDLLLINSPGNTGDVLARSDDTAAQSGGGVFADIDLLRCARDATVPMFQTEVVGLPSSLRAVYAVTSIGGDPQPVLAEGQVAPGSAGGGTLTDTFPALGLAGRRDVSQDGAIAFASLLSTGRSAVFWILPGCGFFTVAADATAAPGGDTFEGFSSNAAQTSADDVVLFRAGLVTAGSGIFRRGP